MPAHAIARHSAVVPVDPGEVPTVRLELIAQEVQVINTPGKEAPRGAAE